ncbi:site-specific DNA-methyltransferase [Planctopirus hydrillae]|uniref:site-specific DNA-methyltransferase (adenine-specific) n=1 Tax=Planctopirus hydrillae TaxID=1841610 RepID=A0A1C3EIQ2_9PLAN|nr:site-specific DNA-methyltransferase [Planctopirus hydrillae]ODA33121.1 DNA methylase [Planctopirus hydrillae]
MPKKKSAAAAPQTNAKSVETFVHEDASRRNIPTAEFQSVVDKQQRGPVPVKYPRNTDLDPQLVWRGKDEQDWSELVVAAPPLYIQEKVHPKALIDDLLRQTEAARREGQPAVETQLDLFADFNGLPSFDARTEFYQHDAHWSNRMILGDSLQVMASLAEREGLRGKVQCIYFDPPYGIKFNSNFQWSTTSRDVKDGNAGHITREPEQVKAFRDTWRDGIHSYLTYLRDRLTVARDLLSDSGSIFVQIGDENVHRVRAVMDEVFGEDNCITVIVAQKTGTVTGDFIQSNTDFIVWYAKKKEVTKYRQPFVERDGKPEKDTIKLTTMERNDYGAYPLTSDGFRETTTVKFEFEGQTFHPGSGRHWGVTTPELERAGRAGRILRQQTQIRLRYFWDDYPVIALGGYWNDVGGATGKVYVVQTATKVIERCILMATDPGDLVLDPTCGSGTTATVAEQWGRRWITIDTSRVALALARARIMGARYPYYLLADSKEGQQKEAQITRTAPSTLPVSGRIRQGFVYERVPHITLKAIANNAEIDVIWEEFEAQLLPCREKLTQELSARWLADFRKTQKYTVAVPEVIQEWEIPREIPESWSKKATSLHAEFWKLRIARQQAIDASIAARAENEFLYDKPYEDKKKVRVAGPFTVESLSPHRLLGVDENDDLIDPLTKVQQAGGEAQTFEQMILQNLKTAGVQQAHKEDRITFTSVVPWPGEMICAEGKYLEGDVEKRAAIFIGPEFGTVQRQDLVQAAREAGDADFEVMIACAFNYEAHATEFNKLGRIPVLKARMNADLHMAEDLKNTGKGNLFVIFGEPDITVLNEPDGLIRVRVNGVDVFKPQTGEVVSHGADGIACWFIDTDYNEESFFVRQAYFLGANDPYSSLKTTLKAEINAEAWESLHSDTSRPFEKPCSGRIAVKVINHLGDEVMKVFRV